MATWKKNQRKYFRGGDNFEVVMIADRDGNIGGSDGPVITLPIGRSAINKFGYTGTDVNGTATAWDANNTTAVYPYPASGVVSCASTDVGDTGESIEIEGLDDNYNVVTETILVGGSGTQTFLRIYRARMTTATNAGVVTINQGGNLAAQILTGNGQTLMAVYTIPAGKRGYLLKFQGSADKSTDVKFKLFARTFGESFNLKGQWGTQGGNPITYDYPIPLQFEEKTDIRVDVTTGASCGCGAIFDILLVDV